jgi:hypothetical protein
LNRGDKNSPVALLLGKPITGRRMEPRKQLSNCSPSDSILHYFLRSRLEICDFIAPVLVREKLVFSD